jgi:hypothetical protein
MKHMPSRLKEVSMEEIPDITSDTLDKLRASDIIVLIAQILSVLYNKIYYDCHPSIIADFAAAPSNASFGFFVP